MLKKKLSEPIVAEKLEENLQTYKLELRKLRLGDVS